MKVLDNTYEPFVSTKQQLAAVHDRELEDFVESRTTVSKFPPPKVRKGVQVVRDFPPGCGIKLDSRPLENLDNQNLCENIGITKFKGSTPIENIEHKCYNPKKLEQTKSIFSRPSGKVKYLELPCLKKGYTLKPKVTTSLAISRRKPLRNSDNGNPKLMHASRSRGINKFKNSTPKEIHERPSSEILDTHFSFTAFEPLVDTGHMSLEKKNSQGQDKLLKPQQSDKNKSRFKPDEDVRNKSYVALKQPKFKPLDSTSTKDAITFSSTEEGFRREKIKEVIHMFNDLYPHKDNSTHWRTAQLKLVKMIKQKLKWIEPDKVSGPICGVQVGDKFKFRLELRMIGLHRQLDAGIDYMKINGKNLAISIVDSHRYLKVCGSSDMLTYSGHGGLGSWGCNVHVEDQKLERGNLALKNSMVEKHPIRVIRKVEVGGKNGYFLYDGLYNVNHFSQKRNNAGKIQFQFQLIRLLG